MHQPIGTRIIQCGQVFKSYQEEISELYEESAKMLTAKYCSIRPSGFREVIFMYQPIRIKNHLWSLYFVKPERMGETSLKSSHSAFFQILFVPFGQRFQRRGILLWNSKSETRSFMAVILLSLMKTNTCKGDFIQMQFAMYLPIRNKIRP